MNKILFLLLISQFVYFGEVKSQDDVILFKDYRLFMVYTRDSIMRELLSTQLCDFSNYCELEENKNISPRLKWEVKINLSHEEIVDILTNGENYGYYNFLEKIKNKFLVIPNQLNYSLDRNDKETVNITLDLDKLNSIKIKFSSAQFGLDNNYNKEINDENIMTILTQNQIIAYHNWKNTIGLNIAKEITRRKIVL